MRAHGSCLRCSSSASRRKDLPPGPTDDHRPGPTPERRAGGGQDPRLANAVEWLVDRQDGHGRWANRHAYARKVWVGIDAARAPSRWSTLRVSRVLRAIG